MNTPSNQTVRVSTRYQVECFQHFHGDGSQCLAPTACALAHDSRLKWDDGFDNLVVTAGLNDLLTRLAVTIPGSVAWYVGLKGTGTVIAADVMSSHAGWAEIVPYSDATRPVFTPGSVASGSVSNTASKAVFAVNATATVYGAFLTSVSTKSGTTGTLYGGGDFASSRAVESGDTLNVTLTLTATP